MKNSFSSKFLFLILLCLSVSIVSKGQQFTFWGDLQPGKHQVGYKDTISFNTNQYYVLGSYSGPKPHFIGMWFPLSNQVQGNYLSYGEYFNVEVENSLIPLRDSLKQMNHNSVIEYGLKHKMQSWEEREFDASIQRQLDRILNAQVNAINAEVISGDKLPVVIYHHGMGGSFEENAVLFEYLASQGYIVVSSNFHWPNQGISLEEIQDDFQHMVHFAQGIPNVDPDRIYVLGHSWGAQVALIANQQGVKGIRSYFMLDSTMESLPLRMIERYYPEIDSIFSNHPDEFLTQSIVITSPKVFVENGQIERQPPSEFEIFRKIKWERFTFFITSEPMDHEAFTSTALLRNAFQNDYSFDDQQALSNQSKAYSKLVLDLSNLFENNSANELQFLTGAELR